MLDTLKKRFDSDDYYKVLSLLFIMAVILIFMGIGLRSPWPADEPRFAEVAREMVVSGNWFFPIRGGELYPDKPPVFMWSIAFFYWLTDSINVAFLLPNALASLVTLFCIYDIASRLWNVRVARNAALLLMIAPQFLIQAKNAQIDAMVTCWITVAMYGLIRHFFVAPHWRWYFTSFAFMGLGIITKGVGFLPILFLIPVLALHFTKRHNFSGAVSWRLWAGPLAMLAVIAMWLFPMLHLAEASGNPDFIAYKNNILFKQTGERYANSWTHVKPWYYFIVNAIPSLWFPLPFLLINKKIWNIARDNRHLIAIFTWIVLVVAFFSLSPGKRGVYIFPALPMLSLFLAPYISHHNPQRWFNISLKAITILLPIAFISVSLLLWLDNEKLIDQLTHHTQKAPFMAFFACAAVIVIIVLIYERKQLALKQFGIAILATWLIYTSWGYVLLEPIRTPAKQIMAKAAEIAGKGGELGIVRYREQFLLFSPVPLTQFSYLSSDAEQMRNAWLWMKSSPQNRYVVMADTAHLECFDATKAVDLGEGHGNEWWLFSSEAMLENCTPPQKIKIYHMPFNH